MKIALPWSTDTQNRYGDEYNIVFNQTFNDFEVLFDFILKYKDIRFNIQPDDMTYQQMEVLDNISPHIYFKIPFDIVVIENMEQRHLKFFCRNEDAPSSFSLLEEQLLLGVTDIYISDDLCYNLDKVKKICYNKKVQVRVILNRIPSKRFDRFINPKTPLFIPEFMEELSNYIDIGEFDTNSWAKIKTYYKIWFEKKEWREDLRYLYPELKIEIPNESLISDFIGYKMNCGYRCGYGSSCRKCEQFVEIARDLKNKNIEYRRSVE